MHDQVLFACGITLYNPSRDIIEHIMSYTDSFDQVIIFDNSDSHPVMDLNKLKQKEQIIYIDGNGNQGLSVAYNKILDFCKNRNIDYLCTLDQDSIFLKKDIDAVKKYIKKHDMNKIGIIAPYINYMCNKFNYRDKTEDKSWTITSGSFLNMKIIKKNNLRYDENYFIDKFEIDLCKQLIRLGYRIEMYYGAQLKQQLGENNGHKHPNHSPLRHRYLFRNRLYFNRKFYPIQVRWCLNLLQSVRHIMLIICYENDKLKKIENFFLGISDYMSGKMGKIL